MGISLDSPFCALILTSVFAQFVIRFVRTFDLSNAVLLYLSLSYDVKKKHCTWLKLHVTCTSRSFPHEGVVSNIRLGKEGYLQLVAYLDLNVCLFYFIPHFVIFDQLSF